MSNGVDSKHFSEWINLKKKLHFSNRILTVHEGEVWWCSCGENIGIEINGKSDIFSRPVLVFKKVSQLGFMGVPITSQLKTGAWYVYFYFNSRAEYAALCQARIMSVSRLHSKIGTISVSEMQKIKDQFIRLYS